MKNQKLAEFFRRRIEKLSNLMENKKIERKNLFGKEIKREIVVTVVKSTPPTRNERCHNADI